MANSQICTKRLLHGIYSYGTNLRPSTYQGPENFKCKAMKNGTFQRRPRNTFTINAGSMADIAFLLLIFFLVSTKVLSEKGILVQLPPYDENATDELIQVNTRNVFSVKVNLQNELMVEGRPMAIGQLRDATKEFLLNPLGKEDLASAPRKAIVSLQNDRGTAYHAYLAVYNELKAAYRECRDEAALQRYGRPYERLSRQEQQLIRQEIPMLISEAEPTSHGEMAGQQGK